MLSILIPTYNYNVFPLVKQLHEQASIIDIDFEILVYDDCSPNAPKENTKINNLEHCSYTILDKNIGRSAIRNLLADLAKFETLLFLDADVEIINSEFITLYLDVVKPEDDIIYGGIIYPSEPSDSNHTLRWVYGTEREALSLNDRKQEPHLRFLTLNFLIKKSVFTKIRFNEEIPNLRHEDTLFAMDAKQQQVSVTHIENPVVHLGLESNTVFLKKSLESVDALKHLVEKNHVNPKDIKLSAIAYKIKSLGLKPVIIFVNKLFKNSIERNLLSTKPSMVLFDFYRLSYYLK